MNLIKLLAKCALVLMLLSAGPAKATMLLLGQDIPGAAADIQAKINGTGLVGTIDYFDGGGGTISLAQLQTYEAVIVWSDTLWQDAVASGNNLASYVDGGGGVVVGMFAGWNDGRHLQGNWLSGAYDPIAPSANGFGGPHTLGTIYDAGHPILAGVGSVTAQLYAGTGGLQGGGVAIADWNNGRIFAAETSANGGTVVSLNSWLTSTDAHGSGWLASTDFDIVMANALNYVAGDTSTVPEPTTVAVLGLGLVGLAFGRKKAA